MAVTENLKKTPLNALHHACGGKMVPFADYEMPVQFPAGVLKEHLHTRASAGLFDVSHMGQARLTGDDPAAALETLVPGDIKALKPGAMRYTLLTSESGGILDDLMVTNAGDHLFVVVNAACKDADFAHMSTKLGGRCTLEILPDQALIAVQGPKAAQVVASLAPDADALTFLTGAAMDIANAPGFVTRSGYTGEDGFEISIQGEHAEAVAQALLDRTEVEPIGLGARDSLRLEAGLCLYGHDIDETTSPIEAALAWTIGKRRREEGGFPGAEIILGQLKDGVSRKRVGLLPEGRAPAREGTQITDHADRTIGVVTSGGFGPSLGGPVAMGYIERAAAEIGNEVALNVRGTARPAKIAKMPFVPPNYKRGA
ncbi:MAG: glycine cleavage system aminomethyltransferase GcvT [Alphaproteobacteria bacterium]|nr:glycine cleavage system aminomethyltransferase GcvT [Alphaproteobacteria bacterium]